MSGDKAVEITPGAIIEGKKETWTPTEKAGLRVYEFTSMIAESLEDCKGKTVEDIFIGFVPPGHPDRGLLDMGWRILIYFKDSDQVLSANPTAAYTQAFMTAAPEDIKLQSLLDELNERHVSGGVRVMALPEEMETEEKEGENG